MSSIPAGAPMPRRAAAALLLAVAAAAGAAPRPHIVVSLIDDWGWRDGPSAIRPGNGLLTPVMNALLLEGVNLDRMYAFRYCSPSRSALLSGRLPIHVNQINLNNAQRGGGVQANMTTIADKLRAAGYRTAQVGKWHAGMTHSSLVPGARGFDYSHGYLAGSEDHWKHTNSGFGCPGSAKNLIDMFETDHVVADAKQRLTGVYNGVIEANKAVQIISEHNGSAQPLFLYLAWHNCHHPMQVPPEYLQLYPDIPEDKANLKRKTYQAMTSFVDAALGNVTAALRGAGMWDTTVLVTVGDNGGPSLTDLDTSNNYPLRGGKYSLFDGGNRVNAFFAGGLVPVAARGATVDGIAHVADLYATFCALAGVPAAERPGAVDEAGRPLPPVDAVDLWPMVSGRNATPPRDELPLSLGPPGDNGCEGPEKDKYGVHSAALIRGRWKLIVGVSCPAHWTGPDSPNGTASVGLRHDCGAGGCLYDIFADPGEHNDLAASPAHAGVAAALRARVAALNATVYQTAWDAAPLSAAECASPAVRAVDAGGVWAPWQQ